MAGTLKVGYGATASSYLTGSVGGIFMTASSLISEHNQVSTNGDPAVFAFEKNNSMLLLVCQYGQANPNNMLIVDPVNWTVTVVSMAPLTNIYSVVYDDDYIYCIDYDTAIVAMFNKSDYSLKATYQQQAVNPGHQINGVALAMFKGYVVALFTESLDPWNSGSYDPSLVVLLNPSAVSGQSLPAVTVQVGGITPATYVEVGLNATGLEVIQDTDEEDDTWYVFATCLGGIQNTGSGNGALSHLDSVNYVFKTGPNRIEATATTHLKGTSSSSLDFRRLTLKADGTIGFLFIGNVYSYDPTTYKTNMTWQLYQTNFAELKSLVNKTIANLVSTGLVLQNSGNYDTGYLWDVYYDSSTNWLIMAHGDSIYVYDLGAASPWTAPIYVFNQTDADPDRELNNDSAGNLNSVCYIGRGISMMGSVPQPIASRKMTVKEFVTAELAKKAARG
jgi:hypothetical protein